MRHKKRGHKRGIYENTFERKFYFENQLQKVFQNNTNKIGQR